MTFPQVIIIFRVNTTLGFTDEVQRLSNMPRDTGLMSRTSMGQAQVCLPRMPAMLLQAFSDSYGGRNGQLCKDSVQYGSREDPVRSPNEARILTCKK